MDERSILSYITSEKDYIGTREMPTWETIRNWAASLDLAYSTGVCNSSRSCPVATWCSSIGGWHQPQVESLLIKEYSTKLGTHIVKTIKDKRITRLIDLIDSLPLRRDYNQTYMTSVSAELLLKLMNEIEAGDFHYVP